MKAFQLVDIQDQELLFGRDFQLKNLKTDAALGINVNIVGIRRFGKTSLLKTALRVIKEDHALNVYPVFLDFKSEGIRGTDNAYRYMIGLLLSNIYKEGICKDIIQIGSTTIKMSEEWIDIEEQLSDLSVMRLQRLFEKIVLQVSIQMAKTILFMIDEYEYLFLKALDSPEGFMKLRTLSTATSESGLSVFSFWLSGSCTWDEICAAVPGSGEANTISDTVYVKPLGREDFDNMWNHECEFIEEESIRSFIQSEKDFVFKASGGVPFYAKNVIGLRLVHSQTCPNYDCCVPFFHEVLNNPSFSNERECLRHIITNPLSTINYNIKLKLENLGLITGDDKNGYVITIDFLRDYLKSEYAQEQQAELLKNNPQNESVRIENQDIDAIIGEIKSLRKRINQVWQSRKLWLTQRNDGKTYPPFKPTIQDSELIDSISKICLDRNDYIAFSGSLYGLYYEGTSKGYNLPWGFSPRIRDISRENTISKFAQLVMVNRHIYGGHVDYVPTEIPLTAEDVYTQINHGKEPSSPEEFKSAQFKMLSMLKEELQKMLDYLKTQS